MTKMRQEEKKKHTLNTLYNITDKYRVDRQGISKNTKLNRICVYVILCLLINLQQKYIITLIRDFSPSMPGSSSCLHHRVFNKCVLIHFIYSTLNAGYVKKTIRGEKRL